MFESSLVASQQRHVSSGERWTAFASITLQVTVAAALVAIPLLHPEGLVFHTEMPHVFLPLRPLPKRPVVVKEQQAASSSATSIPRQGAAFNAPQVIPTTIDMRADPAPATVLTGAGMPAGLPDALAASGTSTVPRVAVASAARTLQISSGVSTGMLLTPIRPVYPAIARAAHVEGIVVVEAIISKAGSIESLRVVSGPEMLRRAAIDAIQSAQYKPYRLNGEPTDVQTTITVNFRLGT
jgi:protein TonB